MEGAFFDLDKTILSRSASLVVDALNRHAEAAPSRMHDMCAARLGL
jgi:hypothetical protein